METCRIINSISFNENTKCFSFRARSTGRFLMSNVKFYFIRSPIGKTATILFLSRSVRFEIVRPEVQVSEISRSQSRNLTDYSEASRNMLIEADDPAEGCTNSTFSPETMESVSRRYESHTRLRYPPFRKSLLEGDFQGRIDLTGLCTSKVAGTFPAPRMQSTKRGATTVVSRIHLFPFCHAR